MEEHSILSSTGKNSEDVARWLDSNPAVTKTEQENQEINMEIEFYIRCFQLVLMLIVLLAIIMRAISSTRG